VALYDDAIRLLQAQKPGIDRDRTLDLLRDGPVALRREHLAGHVTASALIVHHDRDRVLLCLHGRLNRWCQLGGHCEDGDETLAGAALREATEESGIEGLRIHPDPIGIDIHAVTCSAGATHHFDIRFAVIAPVGAAEQVSEESHALGWFAPDDLPSPMADATESLIAPALDVFRRRR